MRESSPVCVQTEAPPGSKLTGYERTLLSLHTAFRYTYSFVHNVFPVRVWMESVLSSLDRSQPVYLLGRRYPAKWPSGPVATANSHARSFEAQNQHKDGSALQPDGSSGLAEEDVASLRSDIRARLWFSYRSGFDPLGLDSLTSDVGWGCTLRSCQMLMAQALMMHLVGRADTPAEPERLDAVSAILPFFYDSDAAAACFSVHAICRAGKRFGLVPGRWMGPYAICRALADISEAHTWRFLKIITIDSGGGAPCIDPDHLASFFPPGPAAAEAEGAKGAAMSQPVVDHDGGPGPAQQSSGSAAMPEDAAVPVVALADAPAGGLGDTDAADAVRAAVQDDPSCAMSGGGCDAAHAVVTAVSPEASVAAGRVCEPGWEEAGLSVAPATTSDEPAAAAHAECDKCVPGGTAQSPPGGVAAAAAEASHSAPSSASAGSNTGLHSLQQPLASLPSDETVVPSLPAPCPASADPAADCSRSLPYAKGHTPESCGLLLLLPVVLGIERTNSVYAAQIQTVLTWPECVGIVGGRPGSSYYFLGYQADRLICMDPHSMQRKDAGAADASTHVSPGAILVPIADIDSTMALGFYCHSRAELTRLCDKVALLAKTFRAAPLVSVGAVAGRGAAAAAGEAGLAWDDDDLGDDAAGGLGAASEDEAAEPGWELLDSRVTEDAADSSTRSTGHSCVVLEATASIGQPPEDF